jgi:quercetin 2,3-dioxygenase
MRTIRKVHRANYHPIADLDTYSPIPSATLQQVDPFIFLNHHGLQTYPPNNNGLPFGPHPHRGMETVTFIIEGDIMHKDSGGHESVIEAGGIQWMTAGSGLIHAEVSSDNFRRHGGPLEILQLWLNLPSKLKMTTPKYKGLKKQEITSFIMDHGLINVQLIAGEWDDYSGSFETHYPIFLSKVEFQKSGSLSKNIPLSENVFLYIVRGAVRINGQVIQYRNLVEFNNDQELLQIEALEDGVLLFGHAEPINEPMVAQGPFVMNTQQEIREAYRDYQLGKFGSWVE